MQKSAGLLQDVHALVGRHMASMDAQQTDISRLQSELTESEHRYTGVMRQRDDAVNDVKRLQQLNQQLAAQHAIDV